MGPRNQYSNFTVPQDNQTQINVKQSSTPQKTKKITVKTKGIKFLIFTNVVYLIVTVGLVFGTYIMYKQLQNINHYLSLNSSVNLSKQIQFDCQATALLPQNCR